MQSSKRGFTLIELLVVVAIIAVLVAILLPSLSRAKDRAITVRCQVNLRNLWLGINLYATDYDGSMLPSKTPAANYWYGPNLLATELGKVSLVTSRDVFMHCPADPFPGKWYEDPSNPYHGAPGVTPIDYTYNDNFGKADQSNGGIPSFIYRKLNKLPKDALVAPETHTGLEKADADYHFNNIDTLFTFDANSVIGVTTSNGGRGPSPKIGHPHYQQKKGNMLFADGTVICDDPFKLCPGKDPNNPTGGDLTTYLWIAQPWTPVNSATPTPHTASFPFK